MCFFMPPVSIQVFYWPALRDHNIANALGLPSTGVRPYAVLLAELPCLSQWQDVFYYLSLVWGVVSRRRLQDKNHSTISIDSGVPLERSILAFFPNTSGSILGGNP